MHKISIVIPTYNCAASLEQCLKSIRSQDYPQDLLDLIIIDGFSKDNTRKVASKYGALILDNKGVIHPEGRAIGINRSSGDIVLCLDSDNVLFGNDWLKMMTHPFSESEIVAAEPLYYFANDNDNLITKYCALIGGDDPIIIYLGYNDRYSYLTGRWANAPVEEKDMKDYLKIKFPDPYKIPSLGANGFMVRLAILKQVRYSPFHHIEVAHQIIKNGGYWAKVKTGIIHNHGGSLARFILKKRRRAERRLSKKDNMGYMYPVSKTAMLNLFLKAALVFPIIFDSARAFKKKPSIAWLYHPVIFYSTILVYGYIFILRKITRTNSEKYELS